MNVRTLEELEKAIRNKNSALVVKKDINLNGRKVILSEGCVLSFKGGSLINGIVIGTKSKLKKTRENVFHNCRIQGEWDVEYASSTMFDNDLDAIILLKNMSCLSPKLKLLANRSYDIYGQGETIKVERIEGDGKEKPKLAFHTTNPNIDGIVIMGKKVTLRNLAFIDDYDVKNDVVYGTNKPTLGNTIAVKGPNNTVETLTIEDCAFSGGTSSSWVASSQTRNCQVKNCTFTGYMADHGVYCAMKAEIFKVENCIANDVMHVNGLFKVRTSNKLRHFGITNVKAHNYNGYLAMISLLDTPEAEVTFDNIKVTRDEGNKSVFYGFCMNDETKNLMGRGYNADRISITNCYFGYGYEGNPVIYSGAGKSVCAKNILYSHVEANESNFGGGISDRIKVSHSYFDACASDKGIYLTTKELLIKKSKLINRNKSNCLFLVNYDNDYMQNLTLRDVEINANTDTIINIVSGEKICLHIVGCRLVRKPNNLYNSPKTCNVCNTIDIIEQ